MNSYKVKYAPSYSSNGCSCCEPTEMEGWDVYHEDMLLRSFYDLQDALTFILNKNGINVEVDWGE